MVWVNGGQLSSMMGWFSGLLENKGIIYLSFASLNKLVLTALLLYIEQAKE